MMDWLIEVLGPVGLAGCALLLLVCAFVAGYAVAPRKKVLVDPVAREPMPEHFTRMLAAARREADAARLDAETERDKAIAAREAAEAERDAIEHKRARHWRSLTKLRKKFAQMALAGLDPIGAR